MPPTTSRRLMTLLHTFIAAVLFSSAIVAAQSTEASTGIPRDYEKLSVASGYRAQLVAVGLDGARTLLFDANGDMLVLARTLKKIVLLHGDFETLATPLEKVTIVDDSDISLYHGMAIRGNHIYASTDTTVYRWPYTAGSRTTIPSSSRQIVVYNMESSGNGGAPSGHFTRTLVFGPDNYLYVSIGSLNNVDTSSSRSRVRRVQFTDDQLPEGGFDFQNMQVWADGLRNGVALTFDADNVLWEADNGPDNLARDDLSPTLFQDNPVEELNMLDGPAGTFYGYPFCWTAGNITSPNFANAAEKGTQYAWPATSEGLVTVTDEWCRNTSNNRPPVSYIPAHSAPITAQFFQTANNCGKNTNSFGCSMLNDLFISLHGSWNRDIATGYKVIRMPFNDGRPTNEIVEIFSQKNYQTACIDEPAKDGTCFRPAGMTFDRNGYLWVSSDSGGELVRVSTTTSSESNDAFRMKPTLASLCLGFIVVYLSLCMF